MKTYMIPVILLMQTMAYAQEPAGNPWTMNPDQIQKSLSKSSHPWFLFGSQHLPGREDYYLVTSTFEFSRGPCLSQQGPSIKQIGHVMHRREQVPEDQHFAPTLRYHRSFLYDPRRISLEEVIFM